MKLWLYKTNFVYYYLLAGFQFHFCSFSYFKILVQWNQLTKHCFQKPFSMVQKLKNRNLVTMVQLNKTFLFVKSFLFCCPIVWALHCWDMDNYTMDTIYGSSFWISCHSYACFFCGGLISFSNWYCECAIAFLAKWLYPWVAFQNIPLFLYMMICIWRNSRVFLWTLRAHLWCVL